MPEFDYKLFHALFNDIYKFRGAIPKDIPLHEEEFTDHKGNDISDCVKLSKLSIFPQLKNIRKWGENVLLTEYLEIKKRDKIVGAKGVIVSGQDWRDIDEPTFYYEFAHLEKEEGVEEYVRELHMDDVIMKVFANLDKKPSAKEKGSDERKALVERAVNNCIDEEIPSQAKAGIKYRCLVEGEHFEVWKVGFHQGSYQLFITAPSFISGFDSVFLIRYYLRGTPLEKLEALEPMSNDQLAKFTLIVYDGDWYNVGVVDLDPELTAKKLEDQISGGVTHKVYSAILKHNFEEVDVALLPKLVSRFSLHDIANMLVASTGTEEHFEQFGSTFLEICRQHYPDEKLKGAYKLLANTLTRK